MTTRFEKALDVLNRLIYKKKFNLPLIKTVA